MNYENHPRYQRMIQKLQAMPQSQRAIFSSVVADKSMADEDMRRRLWGMAEKADEDFRNRKLDYYRSVADQGASLRRDAFDAEKAQGPMAEGLGLANIGMSGWLGKQSLDRANDTAARLKRMELAYGIN